MPSQNLATRDRLARHTPHIWTTQEGERIPITQMETTHLFNAMKMLFNHLADAHGGTPVWFNHVYGGSVFIARHDSKTMAHAVVMMLAELDTRTDLPAKYVQPLEEIRAQVMPRRIGDGR